MKTRNSLPRLDRDIILFCGFYAVWAQHLLVAQTKFIGIAMSGSNIHHQKLRSFPITGYLCLRKRIDINRSLWVVQSKLIYIKEALLDVTNPLNSHGLPKDICLWIPRGPSCLKHSLLNKLFHLSLHVYFFFCNIIWKKI